MPRTWATGRAVGFTLLELMVVLAVLALLTVALPLALPRLVPTQQLRVDSESLAAALRAARDSAVLGGRARELAVSREGEVADANHALWRPGSGADVRWRPAGHDAATPPRFYPDGSAAGGAFLLTLGRRTAEVDVSPLTGRVSVVSP